MIRGWSPAEIGGPTASGYTSPRRDEIFLENLYLNCEHANILFIFNSYCKLIEFGNWSLEPQSFIIGFGQK